MIVYISIGNSDDKLTQSMWCNFQFEVQRVIVKRCVAIHGRWVSLATDPWQNACWCVDIDPMQGQILRERLAVLAYQYGQDSIAWAEAQTAFIEKATP